MVLYVLLMRIAEHSVLKFGVSSNFERRLAQHRSSIDNPFGAKPWALVTVAWFREFEDEQVRDYELRLKRATRSRFKPRAPSNPLGYLNMPIGSGPPSGEWLFKTAHPDDGETLLDVFNDMAALASIPDLILGCRYAVRAADEFKEAARSRRQSGQPAVLHS